MFTEAQNTAIQIAVDEFACVEDLAFHKTAKTHALWTNPDDDRYLAVSRNDAVFALAYHDDFLVNAFRCSTLDDAKKTLIDLEYVDRSYSDDDADLDDEI